MNKALRILLIFLLFSYISAEAGDNPFIDKKPEKEGIRLPSITSSVLGEILIWQRQLNTKLTEQVKKIRNDRSWKTLLPLIYFSFFYGILHAAGPGHGKVVVFSYFISRKSNVKKGVLLGGLISLFHAVSGIVIVLTLYFIIKAAYLSSFETISQKIKIISYGLILAVGIILLINSIFDFTKRLYPGTGNKRTLKGLPVSRGVLPIALAVGIVPCSGVVIIMLFALSFNLLIIGLIMSLLMALGMATTITLSGIISIFGREGILMGFTRRKRARLLFQKGLTIFGSLLIIFLGVMLLAGVI